ncbi:TPA: AAA family ATPase [Streptococcus suis]
MAFRSPKEAKLGAKVLVYGTTGSGKSRFMLGFPSIAAIDSEAGLSFYEGNESAKNLLLVSNTQSFKELEDDLDTIREDYEKLGVKTFAVDSVTKIRENLEETIMTFDERRERAKGKDIDETNLSIRSRGRIKYVSKKLQNLKIDLSSRGVNIVDVAQSKEVKEKKGDQFILVGYEPDMQKGSTYDYDIILFFYTKEDAEGNTHYYAKVEKDRTEVTKKGQIIENPSYDIWQTKLEDLSNKEALNTKFSDDIQTSKVAYEDEVEEENKSLVDRIKELMPNLTTEQKTEFKKRLKEEGFTDLKNLDKLPLPKKESLLEIINSYQ